jgi:hypothetical protein
MKTLVISAIIASVTATASFAQTPNNYIGTDNNGVISERYGNDANTIITRDMATQNELDKTNGTINLLTQEVRGRDEATNDRIDNLDSEIYRVDQEDHRVVDASVNSDGKLVLHSQDMDGGSKRAKVTNVKVGQDGAKGDKGDTGAEGKSIVGAKGVAGTNGTNGAKGAKGDTGLDGVSGISMLSALYATGGNGIGFGVALGSVKEISFVVAVETGRNTNINFGVTHDSHGRTVGTAAIGFSF